MSFGRLLSVISSLFFEAAKSPKGWYWSLGFGNFAMAIVEAVCSLFYWLCKWLLALVDFLQYFIQKLIGLDYWLGTGKKTWDGAIKNDILFSFLYNDTVQKVFRAMIGIFVVLLIIFTIVQIIRQEWSYITGTDGNSFGDGKGNSKAKIIRDALRAIALVLVFPMMLMVGIISSNAILASLVKALNIDMASTFGSTIFAISSQSANKYRLYASANNRKAASNEITFYTDSSGKVILYGKGSETNITYVDDYATYLTAITNASAKKRTVESIFKSVNPRDYDKNNLFTGYCVGINNVWYMVYCDYNKKEDMKLYLRHILKADILTPGNTLNAKISSALGGNLQSDGWISGIRLDNIPQAGDLCQACYHTWRYGTLYSQLNVAEDKNNPDISFERSLSYEILNNSKLTNFGIGSVSTAKVLYNSSEVSPYYDGGQFGFVQSQAEYNVMADVIDFINDNQATLYMMDATSALINWKYTDGVNQDRYQVDSKWIGTEADGVTVKEIVFNGSAKYKAFITNYSDKCSDTETGNVLNLAAYTKSNELEGSKYIMCWKVSTNEGKTEFIPLVNGKTFTDPTTNKKYNFKSTYFDDAYKGVVFAKGLMDANSSNTTNANIGEPTYIKSDVYGKDKNGNSVSLVSADTPYYYELKKTGDLVQFVDTADTGFDSVMYDGIESITLNSKYSGYSWETTTDTLPDATTDTYISLKKVDDPDGVYSFTDDMIQSMFMRVSRVSGRLTYRYLSEYANVKYSVPNSSKTQYLFCTSQNAYFVVELDTGVIRIKSIGTDGVLKSWNGLGIESVSKTYNLKYAYKENDTLVEEGELIAGGLTSNHFEYASSSSDGYSMFQTDEKISIRNTHLEKTMYINTYFDTNKTSLISFEDGKIVYAKGFGDTSADADKSHLTQRTSFYTVYLYNYLTSMIDVTTESNVKFYEYNVETKTLSEVQRPDDSNPDNNEFVTTFNMDVNNFVWEKDSDSISLYNGKHYIAQLFKTTGNTDEFGYKPGSSVSIEKFLKSRSTSISINGKTYYNIETQNCFTADALTSTAKTGALDLALIFYNNSLMDLRLGFYRDNLEFEFLGPFDFNFSLVGNMRFKLVMFHRSIENIKTNTFELYDGISFDYFFDGKIDLYTFFTPHKISYWIILIASGLIIKVLGTSLWGIIKRFYTITLYFIAMPAVASTIPLDSGSRFSSQITKPLITNVLGTYGVILGINVFFILLAPVKSISNIFTEVDIQQSGYFLRKLSGIISVNLINKYVYILFVLVAFTLINDLPKVISKIVGGTEIISEGATTKKAAYTAVKDAGDVVSGKDLANRTKKIKDGVVDFVPGGYIAKNTIGKIPGAIRDHFTKNRDEDESSSSSKGSSRGDEEENNEGSGSNQGGQSEGGDQGEQGQNGGEGRQGEAGANGSDGANGTRTTENARTDASAATTEQVEEKTGLNNRNVERNGTSTQRTVVAAATDMVAENENTSEDIKQEIAKQEYNKNAANNEEIVDDLAKTQANVIKNSVGNASVNPVIANAFANYAESKGLTGTRQELVEKALNGDGSSESLINSEMKKQAILSTMSADEKTKFEALSEREQANLLKNYDVSANSDLTGNIGFKVSYKNSHIDENGRVVDDSKEFDVDKNTSNELVAQMLGSDKIGDDGIAQAISKTGSEQMINSMLGSNLSLGVNYNAGATEVTDMMSKQVFDAASKDESIVSEAILRSFMRGADSNASKEDQDRFEKFKSDLGISDEMDLTDKKNRDIVIGQISLLSKSNNKNLINTMKEDEYSNELSATVKERVMSGKFKISAWDMADEETRKEYSEKLNNEREELTNHSVFVGATDAEVTAGIAAVATNVISDDPTGKIANAVEESAFISNVTDNDLKNMDTSVLKALTGKENYQELTDNEIALLGFVKAKNGNLTNVNIASADDYIKNYKFANEKLDAFNKLSDEQKVAAVEETGNKDLFTRVATMDSSLAVSKENLTGLASSYVTSDKSPISESTKTALAEMYKTATGKDISKASSADVEKFLTSNNEALNLVKSSMKETGYDFGSVVNKNRQNYYARTDEESKREHDLSVDAIISNSPSSIYNAFVSGSVEDKSAITSDLFAKYTGISSSDSKVYKDAVSDLSSINIDSLIMQGYSQDNIVQAYKKAQMFGEIDKNGKGLNLSVLQKYIDSSPEQDNMILQKMESMTEEEHKAMYKDGTDLTNSENYANFDQIANELVETRITPEQKSDLVEIAANSGYNGLSKAEQDSVISDLAEHSGEAKDLAVVDKTLKTIGASAEFKAESLAVTNNDLIKAARKDADVISMVGRDATDSQISAYLSANKEVSDRLRTTVATDKILAKNFKTGLFKGKSIDELNEADRNKAILTYANDKKITVNSKDVSKFVMSADGAKAKEMLVARASEMSYYELTQARNGKSAKQVYDEIKTSVDTNNLVNKSYNSQGSLITNESVQSAIIESADTEANNFVAESYSARLDMLTLDEKERISRNEQIRVLGNKKVSEITANNSVQIAEAQTHALYTDFVSGDKAYLVKQIQNSEEYKNAKKTNGAGFNEEEFIVNAVTARASTGLFSGEEMKHIEQVKEDAKNKTIIGAAIADDEALGVELQLAGKDAVNIENKKRLALGMSSRYDDYANAIESDRDLYKKARIEFRRTAGNEGKELDEVDATTRKNFLSTTFMQKLSESDKARVQETSDQAYVSRILGVDADKKVSTITSLNGRKLQDVKDFVDDAHRRGVSVDSALVDSGLVEAKTTISRSSNVEAVYADKSVTGKAYANMNSNEKIEAVAEYEFAAREYEKQNKGQKFSKLTDENKRAKIKALSEEQKSQAMNEYLDRVITSNMSSTEFDEIYVESKRENAGEEADVFKKVKKDIIRGQIEKSAGGVSAPVDVISMSSEERKNFEFRRNLIERETREDSNSQILANAFRNSNFIGQDTVVNDIVASTKGGKEEILKGNEEYMSNLYYSVLSNPKNAKVYNSIISEYESKNGVGSFAGLDEKYKSAVMYSYASDAKFKKDHVAEFSKIESAVNAKVASDANTVDIKNYLSNEQINAYLKSNERVKSTIIDNAAANPMKALDKQTQQERKLDAVLASKPLQNQVAREMLLDSARDSSGKVDETKIRSMIKSMLAATNPKNNNETYISNNYNELVNKLARYEYLQTDNKGRTTVKDAYKESANKAIETLSNTSTTFDKLLNKEVTKVINPENFSTDSEKSDFFTSVGATDARFNGQVLGIKQQFKNFGSALQNYSAYTGANVPAEGSKLDGIIGLGKTPSDGAVKFENGAFKGAYFKVKRRLPETSRKYDEWNNAVEKKINTIKDGKGIYENMSRSERANQIKMLEAKKIHSALPKDYVNMSNEEQIAYKKNQDALKSEALATNISRVYKQDKKVAKVTEKKQLKEYAEIMGVSKRSANKEKKHQQDLLDVDAKITRYNGTKAMRNKSVDFGTNYNNFINNYFNTQQANNLNKSTTNQFLSKFAGKEDKNGNKIDENTKFADLTSAQQNAYVQIREDAFAGKLNRMHKVASKKVAKDKKVSATQFTEERGIETENVRYKDGSKKYLHIKSRINRRLARKFDEEFESGSVSDKTRRKYDKRINGKKSEMGAIRNQNNLIDLRSKYDKVEDLNRTFRGNKTEYRAKLTEIVGDKAMVDKIYANYGKLLGKLGAGARLEDSPIAVQQREATKAIQQQLEKYSRRAKYTTPYIPAVSSNASVFIGKTMTNAKTKTEIMHDQIMAQDINRALKQLVGNRGSISYDQIMNMIRPSLREDFNKTKIKGFANFSENQKIDALQSYLEKRLEKANSRVHNNNFLKSDKNKLTNLNGTYIKRDSISQGKPETMANMIKTNNSPVYQQLVKNFNSAKLRLETEESNYARLGKALSNVTSGVQTRATRSEAEKIKRAMSESRVKMRTLSYIKNDAENKKKSYEQAFATKQIKAETSRNSSIKFNQNDVKDLFNNYRFPMKPRPGEMGPDGRPMGPRPVRPGSPEARMIERSIGNFIMKYKNQIQTMAKSMIEPELEDMNRYIKGIASNLSNDFGKIVRDLRRTERKLTEKLKKVQDKTDSDSQEIKSKLENNLEQLKLNERNLMEQLKSMGIDINEITAITRNIE